MFDISKIIKGGEKIYKIKMQYAEKRIAWSVFS